jgi:hypothetical protein
MPAGTATEVSSDSPGTGTRRPAGDSCHPNIEIMFHACDFRGPIKPFLTGDGQQTATAPAAGRRRHISAITLP